jgi:polyphosphate glucokinase
MATNNRNRSAATATATKAATANKSASAARPAKAGATATLAVDIGGTGTKTMLLDKSGTPISERLRDETPHPATPEAIVDIIVRQAGQQGAFARVSVGFPGVVHDGVIYSAPNLDKSWEGYDLASALESRLGKPVRVSNDADVQGFGAIQGKGVELVLTLGTGLGSALYVDGHLVPNLELAHHPFRKGRTYEECVGIAALKKNGRARWNRDVARMIVELRKAINFRALYLGGGNTKKLAGALPPDVTVVSNTAGLLGGIALWRDRKAPE